MEKQLRICVIDDDKIYRFTMNRSLYLFDLSRDVLEFSNGEDAITFLRENAKEAKLLPDVIFLDVNMPLFSGWDFLDVFEELKHDLVKRIKIFMFSSSIDSTDWKRAEKSMLVEEFIVKPVDEFKLKELIQNS